MRPPTCVLFLLTLAGSSLTIPAHVSSPGTAAAAAGGSDTIHKGGPTVLGGTKGIMDAGVYARYALAGAFCCGFTHALLTPVDV